MKKPDISAKSTRRRAGGNFGRAFIKAQHLANDTQRMVYLDKASTGAMWYAGFEPVGEFSIEVKPMSPELQAKCKFHYLGPQGQWRGPRKPPKEKK